MKKVFKYPTVVTDSQLLDLPLGAQILCVQLQFGVPCIWALINDKEPMTSRTVFVRGTGQDMGPAAEDTTYIGTIQIYELVFHYFIRNY
jgi:hypothetical protein